MPDELTMLRGEVARLSQAVADLLNWRAEHIGLEYGFASRQAPHPVQQVRAVIVGGFSLQGASSTEATFSINGGSARALSLEAESLTEAWAALAGKTGITSVVTPATISSNQNDYSPGTNYTVARLASSAAVNITGLAGGKAGRVVVLINIGGNTITLVDESTLSAAANRFALNTNIALASEQAAILWYDGTSNRWRCIGRV